MTVKELIEQLSALDPELPVVIRAYEEGLNQVSKVTLTKVIDEDGKEGLEGYTGRYEHLIRVREPEDTEKLKEAEARGELIEQVVYLWSINDGQYTL